LLGALGGRVHAARAERGLTLAALAGRAGLSLRFVSDLEAGKANISVLKLAQVAQALGLSAGRLLGESGGAPQGGVVALLGLRGAGKSTVGRLLAEKLHVPFFELDRLVEAEAGIGLAELFAIHGEAHFRQMELAALRRFLAEQPRGVLATSGGLVGSAEALELVLQRCLTVWLKASPDEHWARVVGQGDLRPMQNRPHAQAELRRRLREREPLYGRARLTCVTSGRTAEAVVRELARECVETNGPRAESFA
jgi:XRE family aerobic/anaerobic benzoate catabolism transcriptional regulator